MRERRRTTQRVRKDKIHVERERELNKRCRTVAQLTFGSIIMIAKEHR